MVPSSHAALFTDLYELSMLQSYLHDDMQRPAAFDLFFRRLRERNYFLIAGIDSALSYLENLHFTQEQLEYLDGLPQFDGDFIDWLASFRFTGDVYAMRDGATAFANEPVLEVVAPLPEAQLVESALLNQITYATNVASKAARVVRAARGRSVAEFGMRRLHGFDAALVAARAAYLAGLNSTSNVLAGSLFGIPISGTMAHSYVQVHDSEEAAFRQFSARYPRTTLLIDTYDTLAAARHIAELYHSMEESERFGWVRLDSGDLAQLSREVRAILDDAGLTDVRIIASNSLDEFRIRDLLDAGAPIDAFGVGTRLGTVHDLPYLDSVYKLVEYDGKPRMKLSSDKANFPGRKQVYRQYEGGTPVGDVVATADEEASGEPLLKLLMKGGRRTATGKWTLEEARVRARAELDRLPDRLHALDVVAEPYPVRISDALQQKTDALVAELRG